MKKHVSHVLLQNAVKAMLIRCPLLLCVAISKNKLISYRIYHMRLTILCHYCNKWFETLVIKVWRLWIWPSQMWSHSLVCMYHYFRGTFCLCLQRSRMRQDLPPEHWRLITLKRKLMCFIYETNICIHLIHNTTNSIPPTHFAGV